MADSVLLIDDDSDVLRAVGDYFDRIGYEVARADAAEPGFEAFERMRPTVVILDLHLPDLDGLELLERLRALGASVILLTGHGDIATAVRAMQLGAAGPGQVLMDQKAFARIATHFEADSLAPMPIKGFVAPVAVVSILRAKSRQEPAPEAPQTAAD